MLLLTLFKNQLQLSEEQLLVLGLEEGVELSGESGELALGLVVVSGGEGVGGFSCLH